MATMRETIHINASPDKVWAGVRDPLALLDWFDGLTGGEMDGTARKIQMGDITVTEEIVTVDDELRRFQYSISEMPIPVEHHLATIDVLEDGDGTLVVYGADVQPDMLGDILAPTIAGAVKGMKRHFES
jgi:Polyketide cyclase / dehydrase and lipid transport